MNKFKHLFHIVYAWEENGKTFYKSKCYECLDNPNKGKRFA